jgi:hypothetical protein
MKAHEVVEEEQAAHDDAIIARAATNGRKSPSVFDEGGNEDGIGRTDQAGKKRRSRSSGAASSSVSVDDALARYFISQSTSVNDQETKKRRLGQL